MDHTQVHRGMLVAARAILEDCGGRSAVMRLHAAGYELIIVGHSLGGGVATLLTARAPPPATPAPSLAPILRADWPLLCTSSIPSHTASACHVSSTRPRSAHDR